MLANINQAFKAYTKSPVNFSAGSFIAVIMYGLCIFAALGVFLVYFMVVSTFSRFSLTDPLTVAVAAIIIILLKLVTSGVNSALARAYSDAGDNKKTLIGSFYMQALRAAPSAFAITIIRDIIWAILLIPVIVLYIFALKGVQYIEIVVGLYAVFITYLIHMLFTPALISSALTNSGVVSSLKQGWRMLQKKHIYFAGVYIVFAITWLLNLIPILQIVSIFVLYPISYSTLITFVEGNE